MIGKNSLVLYKRQPAVVQEIDGDKFLIEYCLVIVLLLVQMYMHLFMIVLKWYIEMQFGKVKLHIVYVVNRDFII